MWRVGARRYLVDAEGRLFARMPDDAAGQRGIAAGRRGPTCGIGRAVGRAVTRPRRPRCRDPAGIALPADVGSAAQRLAVFVTDANGFTVRTQPTSWQAVFGFYTPTLRTPELIPGQVRLLRSLLIGREPLVERDHPRVGDRRDVHPEGDTAAQPEADGAPQREPRTVIALAKPDGARTRDHVLLPLLGLLVGVLAGLVLNINVGFELSRYSAVAILAALDSVLGAVRAELDGVYDNRIFISGFLVNAIIAVLLTFIGDRLGLDLYLVALLAFGLRIFDNVALIRRHFL